MSSFASPFSTLMGRSPFDHAAMHPIAVKNKYEELQAYRAKLAAEGMVTKPTYDVSKSKRKVIDSIKTNEDIFYEVLNPSYRGPITED